MKTTRRHPLGPIIRNATHALVLACTSGLAIGAGNEPDAKDTYSEGLKYLNGDGVSRDEKRAFDLVWDALQAGLPDAYCTMGYFFATGQVVAKDYTKARYYFELGAQKGSAPAQLNYGWYLLWGKGGDKDLTKGLDFLKKAADSGGVTPKLALAEVYFLGDHAEGNPDFAKAREIYEPLAQEGNPVAQNALGVIYRDGLGCSINTAEAKRLFLLSAESGNAKACSNLGHLLDLKSKDRETRIEALHWLLVAKSLNEQTAIVTLEDCEKFIKPDELSAAEVLAAKTQENIRKP